MDSACNLPYLGRQAEMSLSWMSQPVLALLLLIVTIIFALRGLDSLVVELEAKFASACTALEPAANIFSSLPIYIADGINAANARAINTSIQGLAFSLDLALQVLIAVIGFVIDSYRSLFFCLLDLAIHGSLDVATAGLQEATAFIESSATSWQAEARSSVEAINNALDESVGSLGNLVGIDSIKLLHLPAPDLTFLDNLTLPNTIVNELGRLNSSLPTFSDLKDVFEDILVAPINLLREQIQAHLGNATFEVGQLPVPTKRQVELCGSIDTGFILRAGQLLHNSGLCALGVIIAILCVWIIASVWWSHTRYRSFLANVVQARNTWLCPSDSTELDSKAHSNPSQPSSALLSFVSATNHPISYAFASRIGRSIGLARTGQARLYWLASYLSQPGPMSFLAFGLIGLLIVQLQISVLEGPVQTQMISEAQAGSHAAAAAAFGGVTSAMNDSSSAFALESNIAIMNFSTKVNQDIFGFVDEAVVPINRTINEVYNEITGILEKAFNGSVFQDPVLGAVYCLVGSKVDKISNALTWLHDNSNITLPLVPQDALLVDPEDLFDPMTSDSSPISGKRLIASMITSYVNSLKQQRLGFAICLCLWLFSVVCAIFGLVYTAHRHRFGRFVPCERLFRKDSSDRDNLPLKPFRLKPLHSYSSTTIIVMDPLQDHEPDSCSSRPNRDASESASTRMRSFLAGISHRIGTMKPKSFTWRATGRGDGDIPQTTGTLRQPSVLVERGPLTLNPSSARNTHPSNHFVGTTSRAHQNPFDDSYVALAI